MASESLFKNLLQGRCPKCRKGFVFSGWIRMHAACPECGLRFEREHGYFVGAMYISYGLALLPCLLLYYLAQRFFSYEQPILFLITAIAFIPLVPIIFRYSRILWLYLDRSIDPD